MIRIRAAAAAVAICGAVSGAIWFAVGGDDRERDAGPASVAPRIASRLRARPNDAAAGAVAPRSASRLRARPNDAAAGAVAEARRLAQSDPARSREVLRAALDEAPPDVAVMGELARKLVLDESTEARALAIRCLEVAPDEPACKEALARAIDPNPRDDTTSAFLDGCLAAGKNQLPCLAGLAVERLRKGDVDGAGAAAERMREGAPDAPLTVLIRARVRSARGRYREALVDFDAACAAGQDYACYRARALRREGW